MKKTLALTLLTLGALSVACSSEGGGGSRASAILALTPNLVTGATLYGEYCSASCHGTDGAGQGTGEDDLRAAFAMEEDAALLQVVLDGRPGTLMAPFEDLTDQELADIFAYAKSIAGD